MCTPERSSGAEGVRAAPRSDHAGLLHTPVDHPARSLIPLALSVSLAGGLAATPLSLTAQATTPGSYIAATGGMGRFALSAGGRSASIYLSGADHWGVIRAARDLGSDIGRVTDVPAPVSVDTFPAAREIVLVGTLGRSPLLDSLVREGRLDVTPIAGKWEASLLQVVERPRPGIDRALVIAGSDKRGTIYGVYDLSSAIGVSAWYWWADVPVRHQPELFVLPGPHVDGPPAVKYRGIFINDEAPALSGWVQEKFGSFDHQFYEKVFELILRSKGNFLWPAMWGRAFYDDDSLNAPLADAYGVVIGTSHHEPLMRAHDEWRRYGSGPWNYDQNEAALRDFWTAGIRRMGSNESIVTIGMRGDGDMPMSRDANIALLERIVRDQREIIADVTGRDAATVPQAWALYKEVQDYYDKGMRVPDDVTLLFADDNWGNIRRLPAIGAPERAGGYGVYYHFDYVGGPRNYKWINTNPIPRVWEQMHLAYALGVDRIWIVNVGDIKPMEFPISFFLDYAWHADTWSVEAVAGYARAWAARQFGRERADTIAAMLAAYLKYNSRRKPELLSPETYSLTDYREAERVVADYRALATAATRLSGELPPRDRAAFYQLVLHPILASANLNELYVTIAKNRLYAQQGRAAANDLAARARELFRRDEEITRYYNDTLAGGKWSHMMDQTHIGYRSWQEPPRNSMPAVTEIDVQAAAHMGVAIEGSASWWPKDSGDAVLPEIDPYLRQSRYVDVFNRGSTPFEYSVKAVEPWVLISPSHGRVEPQTRLEVTIDWSRAPTGNRRVPLTIGGPDGQRVLVYVEVRNPTAPQRNAVRGFIQGTGYVSMESEHYTRSVESPSIHWVRIPDLGRTGSGMTAMPVTIARQTPGGASPRLEYGTHLFDSGDVEVTVYVSPTLDYNGVQGLRYGISFDDEPPQIVNIHADTTLRAWERSVSDNVITAVSRHRLEQPGDHVLKFWLVDPGIVLQKIVVDAGGVKPSYLGPPESFYRAPDEP
jgi:hypothetical protein